MEIVQEQDYTPDPKAILIDVGGLNASGKTAVAILIAQKLREAFPDTRITAVNMDGDMAIRHQQIESDPKKVLDAIGAHIPSIEILDLNSNPSHDRISVTGSAVRELLRNLEGPGHFIREIQAARFLPDQGNTNPINILKADIDRHDMRKKKFKR